MDLTEEDSLDWMARGREQADNGDDPDGDGETGGDTGNDPDE